MELPANDLTMISVKDAAIIAMCYLDSHASKYLWSTESSLVSCIQLLTNLKSANWNHMQMQLITLRNL